MRRRPSVRLAAALGAAALLLGACTSGPKPKQATKPIGSLPPAFTWARLADAPTSRLEVAAAVVDQKLYVVGGLSPSGITGRVEIYDPANNSWSRGPDLPEPVHHASAVRYRGDLVVLGGFGASGPNLFGSTSSRVWRLVGNRWKRLPSMKHPRGAGAAGVVGDRLVVAAGQADGKLVSETEVFDGTRWRDGAAVPTLRDHVASASDGKHLYVISGRRLGINAVVAAFERYGPVTNRWEELPDAPTPRGGFGAAFIERVLLTVGGEGPAGTYPQLESFGPEGRWSRLPAMPQARHGVGIGVIGRALYVAVGGPTAGGSYSSRLDVFSLD